MDRDGIAITAHGLTRDFGDFRAVDRVDFQVRQGEIFGLLGANGAGKTTVIKMLMGLLSPSAGEGQVAGVDMRRPGRAIKQRIGYMSQAFSLYHDLSVMENLSLYGRIYAVRGERLRREIQRVLDRTGLERCARRLAGDLPMGLRQRLAIACALVHGPRVLFLDEPTSGVDPIGRRRFWDILVRLAREERVAILVTTHHMAEAEHCDRLALMVEGRIVTDASPQTMKRELVRDVGTMIEVTTDHPLAALEAFEEAGFEGAALYGRKVHLLARDPHEASTRIRGLMATRGIRVDGLTPHEPTLEDVFVYRILALEREREGKQP
ncbi:MAG: ABC transporter ATP-binding protein [Deltaproteobacteria bacterium]|nr:ABC transporter ATP-binding protein [Deltaproteobacteria bacterium]